MENIEKVYLQKGFSGPLYSELQKEISREGIYLSYISLEKVNKLTKGNHQGVVAKISPVKFREIEDVVQELLTDSTKKPLFLLLDQITGARNFGAIIRTAECYGVHAIIVQNKEGHLFMQTQEKLLPGLF